MREIFHIIEIEVVIAMIVPFSIITIHIYHDLTLESNIIDSIKDGHEQLHFLLCFYQIKLTQIIFALQIEINRSCGFT